MVNTPQFGDFEFMNAAAWNAAFSQEVAGSMDVIANTFTAGLINPSYITTGVTGLSLSVTFGSSSANSARILFGNGVFAGGFGTASGSLFFTYTLNLASFVPSSGSQVVYIVATATQIGQNAVLITGPTKGHPDYDPTFVPYTLYTSQQDTVALSATTSTPDNFYSIEICRFTLVSGQTIISGISTAYQVLAGAILSKRGEVTSADLASGAAATNVGTLGGLLTGTLPNPGFAAGAAAYNIGTLGGVLSGSLPNPSMAAGAAATNVGTLGGALSGTLPNPGMAAGAAATNVGTLGGVLSGTLPNPSLATNVNLPGSPTTTTQATTDNSTNIATTAFSQALAATRALVNGSSSQSFSATTLTLNNTSSQTTLYTDASTNDLSIRTGASGSYSYVTINSSGQIIAAQATSSNQMVTLGQFPSSLSGNGYKKIADPSSPSGYFIIQWGSNNVGAPTSVTFPITFPNAFMQMVVTEAAANSGTWGAGRPTIHGWQNGTTSGYTAWAESWTGSGWTGGSISQSYIAVGY